MKYPYEKIEHTPEPYSVCSNHSGIQTAYTTSKPKLSGKPHGGCRSRTRRLVAPACSWTSAPAHLGFGGLGISMIHPKTQP